MLELVAAGCTNDQIGRLLFLSGPSVNRVVAQLLMRTQTKNRAELVARAFTEGVLDPLEWPPRLTGQNTVRLARERRRSAERASPHGPPVPRPVALDHDFGEVAARRRP